MRRWLASFWLQAVVLSAFIVGGVWVAGYYQSKAALRKPQQAIQAANTPDKAAQQAEAYLLGSFDQVDPMQRLILDYLQRKFELIDDFSGEAKLITVQSKNADVQREFNALIRIAYPDRLVSDLGPDPSLVTRAANCDHIPLPKDYSQQLQAQAEQGDYSLTHVALSVQIAKELGCNVALAEPLTNQAREGITALINDKNTPADLRYECIAFLQYMGFKQDVKKAWVDQILTEQQPEGWWASGSTGATTDHATVLAFWALLEYTQPNAKNEPMIRL